MAVRGRLVGRAEELSVVLSALGQQAQGSLLVLAGEAGIGKSHLLESAVGVASGEGLTVLSGRCLSLRQHLPFLPIADVVRDLATREGGRILRTALGVCPAYVKDEVRRLVPELGIEVGEAAVTEAVPEDWRRLRMFDAIRLLLCAAADANPLAVVIEDAHWADPSSQDLVRYLMSPTHLIPIPLVLSTRIEGEQSAWLRELADLSEARWLGLGPLSRSETVELVQQVVPASQQTHSDIFRRSGGNPLFVQHLASADVRNALPESLEALLLRRLSGLEPLEVELVRLLSVVGRPLDDVAVHALLSASIPEVADALRALTSRLLIYSAATHTYEVRHALLAEAVGRQMTTGERVDLSLRAARHLADRAGDASAGDVAEHFAVGGDLRSEFDWRLRAAHYADSVAAPVEGARQWRRLVDLTRDGSWTGPEIGTQVNVHLKAVAALQRAGRDREALALSELALESLRPRAARADQVRLLFTAGRLRAISDPASGLELVDQAIALGKSLTPTAEYVRALHQKALFQLMVHHGDRAAQTALLTDALAAARAAGLRPEEKLLTAALAWRAMAGGERDLAVALVERSREVVLDVRDPALEAEAAVYATDVHLKCGSLETVVELGNQALDAAIRQGYPRLFQTVIVLANVLEALRELGRISQVASLVADIAQEAPNGSTDSVHSEIAALRCTQGNLAAAEAYWTDLEDRDEVNGLQFSREFALVRDELFLWQRRPGLVLPDALLVLEPLSQSDESAMAGGLFVLALRACADRAQLARGLHDEADLQAALVDAAGLEELLGRCAVHPFAGDGTPVTSRAESAAWAAELARCHGVDSPEVWASAADAWAELRRPHRAAYALYRQAETILADPGGRGAALPVLRSAVAAAREHAPLTAMIRDLAERAHLQLEPRLQRETVAVAEKPFGLTGREMAVLQLVAAGLTNGQIGARLFISTSTASVHVTNILRKMRVTSRVQAAAIAAQTGLLASS